MSVLLPSRIGAFQTTTVGGESVRAYLPPALPPRPELVLSGDDQLLYEQAASALGRLDGLASILPDSSLFIYFYVRKEAVLSSQIEGTQSSLSELLLFENVDHPVPPTDDLIEVSNYVKATEYGMTQLREGMPLSLRLIRGLHGQLLTSGRGSKQNPGEFRTSQNWVAGSRPGNALYVPPPQHEVARLMGELEIFLNVDSPAMPVLVKAALAHVQFETIHPFLDGNGRVGRLLITLILCAKGVLREPLLYLSLYLKSHRERYYDLLQRVRIEGDWEAWVRFFMEGVRESATQACATALLTRAMFEAHRGQIQAMGRKAANVLRVQELLQRKPIVSVLEASTRLSLSQPTIRFALVKLQELGIVRETSGKARNRLFAYDAYLKLLDEGTVPNLTPVAAGGNP